MSASKITNGGVKSVVARVIGGTICVEIFDNEGLGERLEKVFLPNIDGKPEPRQVEEWLLDNYELAPTWFWTRGWGRGSWSGQFAYYTNHKCSPGFFWA